METLLTLQEENESNGEGQECRTFNELTHINEIERQSPHAEQLNPYVEQEVKGRLPLPSRGSENLTQANTACVINAKQSGFQGKEQSQYICESEVGSDNVSKRGVQRALQTVQMASEASVTLTDPPVEGSPTMPRQKLSDQEDPQKYRRLSGANQVESCYPSQHNPSTNGTGRLGKSGGSSRESLLDLGNVPLLSDVEKSWREHTGINSKVSLAEEEGVAGERHQAEAYATGSELGEEKVERRRSVLCHNVSGTTHYVGGGFTIGNEEQECPVCIELYDSGAHKQALLNCNHSVCDSCVKSIMEKVEVNSTSQICCPICRQRTPMPEWEIRQLQEEMAFLNQAVAGRRSAMPIPPASRGGPCRRLEQAFRQRLQTTRSCGYLPCLHYPLWLVNTVARCEQTSPCCYFCSIFLLYGLEFLCLSLIFTPLIVLILLFTLLDKQ
ncbi:uncharacterized protein LOC144686143 [Cetorhinus maximus]